MAGGGGFLKIPPNFPFAKGGIFILQTKIAPTQLVILTPRLTRVKDLNEILRSPSST